MADSQKFRLIFMGTPDFGARALRQILTWPKGEIVGVYTQPDRPAGRGHKLVPSLVKKLAIEHNLPVFQPQSLKSLDAQQEFAALRPDFLLVAAYGLLLPDAILAVTHFPPLNIHPSLLPRYRGAAPVQRAIMENWLPDARIGVCVMGIEDKLDAGPVYAASSRLIENNTSGEILAALADEGALLLLRVMDQLIAGKARPFLQDEAQTTYAAKISKHDTFINWNIPVAAVHAHIRALTPIPGARSVLAFNCPTSGEATPLVHTLLLSPGSPVFQQADEPAGTIVRLGDALRVACADGWYELRQVKPQGTRAMLTKDFLNGHLRKLPYGYCGNVLQDMT